MPRWAAWCKTRWLPARAGAPAMSPSGLCLACACWAAPELVSKQCSRAWCGLAWLRKRGQFSDWACAGSAQGQALPASQCLPRSAGASWWRCGAAERAQRIVRRRSVGAVVGVRMCRRACSALQRCGSGAAAAAPAPAARAATASSASCRGKQQFMVLPWPAKQPMPAAPCTCAALMHAAPTLPGSCWPPACTPLPAPVPHLAGRGRPSTLPHPQHAAAIEVPSAGRCQQLQDGAGPAR